MTCLASGFVFIAYAAMQTKRLTASDVCRKRDLILQQQAADEEESVFIENEKIRLLKEKEEEKERQMKEMEAEHIRAEAAALRAKKEAERKDREAVGLPGCWLLLLTVRLM